MKGPAGVMALVLAEAAAGGAALLFLTPLWREVRKGFFYLTGLIVMALAAGAAGAAAGGYSSAFARWGRVAVVLSLALAGATAVWMALIRLGLPSIARILGVVTVPLAGSMLLAYSHTADESASLAFFQLLAGAAFTGAVLDGLLLGHWYLTDRKLGRGPINRMTWILMGSVVLEAVGVIAGGSHPNAGSSATSTLNPLLTIAGSATWIAIGMVACTGLIAAFIRATLRGTRPSAVQSATGFFYLAVITAFTAELASKVRLLP
jgi:hypothetical protein